MTVTKRPTKEALLDALEEADAAEEAERIRLLSDDALDRELAAEGFDPAAERARGRALGAPARRLQLRPPSVPRWVPLLAAVFALGALALAIGPGLSHSDRVSSPPPHEPSPADLRHRAFEACDAERWAECLANLDAAWAQDRAGDEDPRVQSARRRAAAAMPRPTGTSSSR